MPVGVPFSSNLTIRSEFHALWYNTNTAITRSQTPSGKHSETPQHRLQYDTTADITLQRISQKRHSVRRQTTLERVCGHYLCFYIIIEEGVDLLKL